MGRLKQKFVGKSIKALKYTFVLFNWAIPLNLRENKLSYERMRYILISYFTKRTSKCNKFPFLRYICIYLFSSGSQFRLKIYLRGIWFYHATQFECKKTHLVMRNWEIYYFTRRPCTSKCIKFPFFEIIFTSIYIYTEYDSLI